MPSEDNSIEPKQEDTTVTAAQKAYLETDLVKYRIKIGFLTVEQALSESSPERLQDIGNAPFIQLGFSSSDIALKNTPNNQVNFQPHKLHVELLKKYIEQIAPEDIFVKAMSGKQLMDLMREVEEGNAEERKIDAEAFCERAQKLEAFFRTMCSWSITQASAFIKGSSIEQVNSLRSIPDFSAKVSMAELMKLLQQGEASEDRAPTVTFVAPVVGPRAAQEESTDATLAQQLGQQEEAQHALNKHARAIAFV